jgi:hypothetical protein
MFCFEVARIRCAPVTFESSTNIYSFHQNHRIARRQGLTSLSIVLMTSVTPGWMRSLLPVIGRIRWRQLIARIGRHQSNTGGNRSTRVSTVKQPNTGAEMGQSSS